MLASITPLGERGRGRRWGFTAAAYVAGSLLGGTLAGAVFGAAGSVVGGARPVFGAAGSPGRAVLIAAAAAIVLAAGAVDASRLGLPSVRRQVNEDWLVRYRSWVYGGGFGFQLGLGVVTYVPTAAVYAMWVLAALTGTPVAGAAVGAAFGVARALPVLAAVRVRTPASQRAFHVRMQGLAPAAQWATVVALSAIGLATLGVAAVTA